MKTVLAPLPEAEILDPEKIGNLYLSGKIDLICVLGPTASGKTKYAVKLAKAFGNAEIISADSRQVYRGMDIGTGKDLADYDGVPYHLIDIRDAGEQYNVFEYKEDFNETYRDIRSRGAIPILCGGTGMYISAVTSGYDFKEKHPHSEAAPAMAQRTYFIGTLVERGERNARIDARLKSRLAEGMVDEIRSLIEKGVSPTALMDYGLEYRFVTRYILGELDYDEMKTLLATAIHQFAKRQMTWFRGMERSGIKIHWTNVQGAER